MASRNVQMFQLCMDDHRWHFEVGILWSVVWAHGIRCHPYWISRLISSHKVKWWVWYDTYSFVKNCLKMSILIFLLIIVFVRVFSGFSIIRWWLILTEKYWLLHATFTILRTILRGEFSQLYIQTFTGLWYTQQNSNSISHLLGTVTTQWLPLWWCSHCSLVLDTVTTEQWLRRTHLLLGIHYHGPM